MAKRRRKRRRRTTKTTTSLNMHKKISKANKAVKTYVNDKDVVEELNDLFGSDNVLDATDLNESFKYYNKSKENNY